MTPEQTLDWLAEQHKSQCNENRPVQEWIRSMKSMLPAPVQSAERVEPVWCGHCNGSGRMVRDPDIGTDQECFVCDGAGVPAAPVQEPHKSLSEHITQATNGRVYVDPVTGDVGIGTPVAQPVYTQEDLGRAFSKGFIEGEKMAILEAGLEKRKSAPVQSAERVEPVAWWNGKHGSPVFAFERDTPGIGLGNPDATPLYTTPPAAQRQPLTDEQIKQIYTEQTGSFIDDSPWALLDFARAIEAAHGIKENT